MQEKLLEEIDIDREVGKEGRGRSRKKEMHSVKTPSTKFEFLSDRKEVEFEKSDCISISNWFLTFLIQDLPIIGEIALIVWAFSKRNALNKRQYAIARLIYKLIFDAISIAIIIGMYMVARELINSLIQYMEAL